MVKLCSLAVSRTRRKNCGMRSQVVRSAAALPYRRLIARRTKLVRALIKSTSGLAIVIITPLLKKRVMFTQDRVRIMRCRLLHLASTMRTMRSRLVNLKVHVVTGNIALLTSILWSPLKSGTRQVIPFLKSPFWSLPSILNRLREQKRITVITWLGCTRRCPGRPLTRLLTMVRRSVTCPLCIVLLKKKLNGVPRLKMKLSSQPVEYLRS